LKVSVIIPNYNHADYLEKRIESVLNQTYTNFEVIILDDHSTDNSAAIINRYKEHPKVAHIVYNQINSSSTFKQWEKGVALADADHIWIAESDDYADEHFLENAMVKLCYDNTVGLYFCDYYSIDDTGNITASNNQYLQEFVQYFDEHENMNGKYFCERYLFFSCLILNASAVVFRKSLFAAADKSYIQMKVSGDWRMWVNICYDTNIFFDQHKLNYFRMHEQNVRSQKARLMGAEAVQNMVYFVKKTPDKSVQQKLKDKICKTWIYSFYLDKGLRLNTKLLGDILSVDALFPLRLLKRIGNKLSNQKYDTA
jgi:glycosyltransferase involved in cell wall biosynthesis